MRWIYISPHLDDAVLSAGGLIYEQTQNGIPVETWTVVCGFPATKKLSPFAEYLHQEWGMSSAEEVVRNRRDEDKRAASIVGAKPVHFDVPDCIYRQGPDGEFLYGNIFVPLHEAEVDLPNQIAAKLAPHLEKDDVLVCQLAVGGHVDHLLVRQAAEKLERPLLYLADIPYLLNTPEDLAGKVDGMKEVVHPITEAGLKSWQDAVAAYASQMAMLFEGDEMMRTVIQSYWEERKGIRLWEVT